MRPPILGKGRRAKPASLFYAIMFDYNDKKWKAKSKAILRRDNYECRECRKYGRIRTATTVHHIKHVDEFPELAFDNDNLISLCSACHNKQHPEKGGNKYWGSEY